ncbi:MAG: LysM peptidoglycan-binding domain-containing protein [Kiritimatiellales bacterium]|nr:LysM peptidoglycan-binding domain-containing protein [Kiritimatiellales bacterium]
MNKVILLLMCSVMLAGCGKSSAQLDTADEKDARVRKGLELVQQKNPDAAAKQFEAALMKKPELGRPELELAMIYQQKKNYARAIYHYERYLEKRPLTEKRALIQEWIKQAKVSLAGETGGDISGELARLTRENNMLRKQLEAAGGASAAPVANVKTLLTDAPPPRPAPVPVVTQPVEKVQPAPVVKPTRTYTVRAGDTLSRIAGAMYGDAGQWKKIYEANREQMKNEGDIKVGQTLVIPNP